MVELVDTLLDNYIYPEIADILNVRGIRPGGSARRGQSDARFTALRVAYLAHEYALRSRYDRLRARGMFTREEAASRLGICESTLIRWVEHGLVVRHAYNAHASLYEVPSSNPPVKHCSRWDRLIDRHVRFGRTPDAAREWVLRSDEANARLIEATRRRADLVIHADPDTTPS